uniref:Uncharacterized protein n=1 Tax=Arundo donax TaxID=35708 RepID=A0A0A9GE51_ARUDO
MEASAVEGSSGWSASVGRRCWCSGLGADGGCGAKRVTTSEQNRRMGRPRSTS